MLLSCRTRTGLIAHFQGIEAASGATGHGVKSTVDITDSGETNQEVGKLNGMRKYRLSLTSIATDAASGRTGTRGIYRLRLQ